MPKFAAAALLCAAALASAPPTFADDRAAAAGMRARELAGQERCEEALQVIDEARVAAPDDATLLLVRGQCELRLRRWSAGAADLQRAADLDPTSSAAPLYLGIARYHEGDLEAARAALERAREQGATGAELELYTGLVLLQSAEHREAALALERARTANAGAVEPVASYYAGLAWQQGDERERAIEALERVGAEHPDTIWAEEADRELERARRPLGRTWAMISAGMEYDSNVVQLGNNQPLPNGISDDDDWNGAWALQAGAELFRSEGWSGGAIASYQGNAHVELDEYDTHYPVLTLWLDREFDRETVGRILYDTGYAWIDNEPFLFNQTADASTFHNWGPIGESGIGAAFYWNNYLFSSRRANGRRIERLERDALGLSPHIEHRVPLNFADTWLRGRYTYTHQWGDGKDWDFDAHEFRVGLETTLPLEVHLDASGAYIYQPFENDSFFDEGDDREDNIWIGEVVLSRAIGSNWSVSAEYSYIDDRSNVNAYDYDRHIVGLFVTVRLP